MLHALIIPTYGFITPDPNLPGGAGTIARFRKAQALVREGTIPRMTEEGPLIIPFPQDQVPRDPREVALLGPDACLGENAAAHAAGLPEFEGAEIRHAPLSRGTWRDTFSAISMVDGIRVLLGCRESPVTLHFVSDPAQLGRLWLIWHVGLVHEGIRLEGWQARFYAVPDSRSRGDLWRHEVPAYAKCLCLCMQQLLQIPEA